MLLTDLTPGELQQVRGRVAAGELHPKQAKVDLATRIVSDFHGAAEAERAAAEFDRRFAKKELLADSLEEITWELPAEPRAWRQLIIGKKLAASGGEADQKLKQGAVKVDGRKVDGPFAIQQEYPNEAVSTCSRSAGRRTASGAVTD